MTGQSTLTHRMQFLPPYPCSQQEKRLQKTKCIFQQNCDWNECTSQRSACFSDPRLLCRSCRTKAPSSPKKPTHWVPPGGLEPRFPLPCWGHTYAFDCYLLVSATTYRIFANSCHTVMYSSVFGFVYAHFTVAIIDSCCMDEKKIWIKLFDLLMQQVCDHCVTVHLTAGLYSRRRNFSCFNHAETPGWFWKMSHVKELLPL